MGLDAYVYCSRTRLPFPSSMPGISIDERTGVIDFDDPDLYRQFADEVVSLHHRLGNIAKIAQLKEQIQRTTANLPIITENVLGTGTHCGDVVDLCQIDALEREVHLLTHVLAPCSPDMLTFLS